MTGYILEGQANKITRTIVSSKYSVFLSPIPESYPKYSRCKTQKVLRIEAKIFASHIIKRDVKGENVHRVYKIGNRYSKHSLVLILRSYINSTTYLSSRVFNISRNGKLKTTSRLFMVGILRKRNAGGETDYNLIYK